MDLNDPDGSAARALKYLCIVGNADRHTWFTIKSLSSDLGLSAHCPRGGSNFDTQPIPAPLVPFDSSG
jgi:hypothetical protein